MGKGRDLGVPSSARGSPVALLPPAIALALHHTSMATQAGQCQGKVDVQAGATQPCPPLGPRRPWCDTFALDPPLAVVLSLAAGPAGHRSAGEGAPGRGRLSACLPTPAAWYPTLGSPWGYLTPSLSSSFLWAEGRSAASHIPKETVGSFEKVGQALGCLFIALRALRSHASVPQRNCTGLFIFPLLCFPLGYPSQECRWYCRYGEVKEDSGRVPASLRGPKGSPCTGCPSVLQAYRPCGVGGSQPYCATAC